MRLHSVLLSHRMVVHAVGQRPHRLSIHNKETRSFFLAYSRVTEQLKPYGVDVVQYYMWNQTYFINYFYLLMTL